MRLKKNSGGRIVAGKRCKVDIVTRWTNACPYSKQIKPQQAIAQRKPDEIL